MAAGSLEFQADAPRVRTPPRTLDRLPPIAGAAVGCVAATVLTGWAIGDHDLQRLFVYGVTVKANTAVGLGLAAVAMVLSRPDKAGEPRVAAARVLASLVAMLGALTLLEYLVNANLGLDEFFFRAIEDVGRTPTPGRMAAVTATGFVLLGTGLLSLDVQTRRGFHPASTLLAGAAALGLTALLGYVYGAIPKEGLGQGVQIAVPTAVAFVLLGIGSLAQRPTMGWMAQFMSPHAGGLLARRLVPFAFIVPLALGALKTLADAQLRYNVATVSGIVAVATMFAFGVVIMRTSAVLDAADGERLAAIHARVGLALREEAARSTAAAEQAAREQAERLLRDKTEALTLLDVVIASAPVGFALFDRTLRCVRVNAALASLGNLTPEECIGQRSTTVIPGLASTIDGHVRRVLSTNDPLPNVAYALPAESHTHGARSFLTSYYPVRVAGGDLVGVGVFVVETTDRKALESQLLQAQKMDAVGQLAGGIAHDFNNLLTVISSYASILAESLGAEDARRPDVREIQDAATRATQLTRQLLAFSRKQVVEYRSLDVNAVVARTEKMLRRLIGEDVTLRTTLATNLHPVYADAGQLEQVLVNLAVNARDAMPHGGRLSIETANVVLGEDYTDRHGAVVPGDYVMLAVGDTGTGMTPDVLAHVFEPFFTTKEVGRGTGLGLSTVYGIVTQFGGDVWVYSELGHGTTFKIYLPRLADDVKDPSTVQPPTPRAGGGETVLLVEDEPRLRQLAERVLRGNGYRVLSASDGAAALAMASAHDGPIHLVLSDVVMPGMTARELVERLKIARPTATWIFMSGYTDDDVLRRGVFEHQTTYLEKPFTPESLLAKIGEALSKPE